MKPEGKTIKVKSAREVKAENTNPALGENRKLYATIAYHYPQYSLQDAEALPYRDIVLLLNTATRIEAERMHNLTLIASAPHSEKGKGVKTLLKHFKELIKK